MTTDRVSVRRAARSIGCTERHVRLLVRQGKLESIGRGATRTITVQSIQKYQPRRKKVTIALSTFIASAHKRNMEILQTLPGTADAGTISRLFDIPEPRVVEMIKNDSIPTVDFGGEKLASNSWLRKKFSEVFLQEGE